MGERNFLGGLVIGGAFLALAGCEDQVDVPQDQRIIDPSVVVSSVGGRAFSSEERLLRSVGNWRDAKRNFESWASYERSRKPGSDIENLISQGRMNFAIDGAALVKNLLDDSVLIDQKGKLIEMDGAKFDLKNRYQLYLLDRIVDRMFLVNSPVGDPQEKAKAARDLEDLRWLAREDLPVVFTSWFIYPHEEILTNLARFSRTIFNLGYVLPAKIEYKFPGLNDLRSSWYDHSKDEIVITTSASIDSIYGLLLSQQRVKNKEFSQEAFNLAVDLAKQKAGLDLGTTGDSGDMYFNPDVLRLRDPESVMREDYIETLKAHLIDGSEVRSKLKRVRGRNPAVYEVLKAREDFATKFYQGSEYSKNGEVFAPKAGQVWLIDDPDFRNSGIYLRGEDLRRSPNLPLVYHNDYVWLAGGEEKMIDPESGEEKIFWVVRRGSRYRLANDDIVFVFEPGIGRISQEWFGEQAPINRTSERFP